MDSCRQHTLLDVGNEAGVISYGRTIAHEDEIAAERQAVLEKLEQTRLAAEKKSVANTSSEAAQTQWGNDGLEKTEPMRRRSKIKICSIDHVEPTKTKQPTQPTCGSTGTSRLQIAVSPDSRRVFTRMFPGSPEDIHKGSIKWQHFVGAMKEAGFVATYAGGSCVSFAGEAGGSMVFHKPHPDPDVDQIMLMAMGKRMAKWFGWQRASFADFEM